MAKQLQLRRGTTAQHSTFTGAVGEVTVDTDKKILVVHDGSTAGGIPAAKDSTVVHNSGDETVAGVKTFTGTVVMPSTTSIGNVSNTEIGYLDGVTSAIQTQINTKAPLASPTFTGTVVLPSTTSIGTVSNTEIGYLDGVTSAIQTQLGTKAPLASPALTGTPTAPTATVNTSTTQIASTAFATPRTSTTGASAIPAGTTAQRPASPSNGYLRYNTDLLSMEGYINGAWGSVGAGGGGGATGAGGDKIFVENGQTVTTSYTITSGNNAMTAGDITINTGVTVTVPSGSRWVIV